MVETRTRREVVAAVVLGVLALLGIGFWIGRTHPGSTASPEILRGTVVLVNGGTPAFEFVVDLDGSHLDDQRGYGIGPVPWTDGPNSVHQGDTPPPCVAVGHHIAFGVVHVALPGFSTDEVVWVDCAG